MRDLLYLSETKMQALIPQLPRKFFHRFGFEGKVNLGVASIGANMPKEAATSNSIERLEAVIDMIESGRGSLWRTDEQVRVGDWIQFDEQFYYGSAWPGRQGSRYNVSGLVYFAAVEDPSFVMCGSGAHVLDRRQLPDESSKQTGHFYLEGFREYARLVSELPDEAAGGDPPTPPEDTQVLPHGMLSLGLAVRRLSHEPRFANEDDWEEWSEPVKLSGHARILAAGALPGPHGVSEGWLLATPLYVEYAPT